MPPKTRYARSGDVDIAYQVLGDGPVDLIVLPGFISNLDLDWTDPYLAAFWRRLAGFSRLIRHDKRGTGLSDPVVGVPPLEQRMEDVHAVLDDVGSERAFLLGISEGGPASLLFAATYPKRTEGLILYGTFAKGTPDDVHEGALPAEPLEHVLDAVINHWGDGSSLDLFMPSLASRGDREREQRGIFGRAAASPTLAKNVLQAVLDIDVTDILPTVRVPTLVLHRTGDVIPISGGRYIADRVPRATFVELPGNDHAFHVGDTESILDEIEGFVTGSRGTHRPERVLATVLFTDIVDSTKTATEIGDERWREVLAAHDEIVRRGLEQFGGREVKHTGDGVLAAFDGPARAIRCACTIRDELAQQLGITIRAGLHTGECEMRGDDVGGLAVHIGARVAAAAGPAEVLVSSTVRDLVTGSEIAFSDRGMHELKGVPGQWTLLAVTDERADSAVGTPSAPERIDAPARFMRVSARHAPWIYRQIAKRRLYGGAERETQQPPT